MSSPLTPHRRRSTLIVLTTLPPSEPHASAVAVDAALLIATVLTSPFHPCCRHCRHRVAVSAKKIPPRRRRCCHRIAHHRRFAVAVPASLRRCCRRQAKTAPPPLLLPPPFPSLPFSRCHSSLASDIVATASLLPPSKACAATVAVTTALPVVAISPLPLQPHRVAATAAKQSARRHHCFRRCFFYHCRFAIVIPA